MSGAASAPGAAEAPVIAIPTKKFGAVRASIIKFSFDSLLHFSKI